MARTTVVKMARGSTPAAATVETPPLFSQGNVRKPEYWQFARLIAPAAVLPIGKRAWTADDAVGIWCERCNRKLQYQKGSSQSIRYHMETKHSDYLHAFRKTNSASKAVKKDRPVSPKPSAAQPPTPPPPPAATAIALTAPSRGTKRKECPTTEAAPADDAKDDNPSALDRASLLALPLGDARSDSCDDSDERDGERDSFEDGAEDTSDLFRIDTSAPLTAATSSLVAPRHFQTGDAPPSTSRAPAIAPPGPVTVASTAAASATSWHRNVQRRSGFWGNAYWYDLHLSRRMPLAEPMLRELIAALPPCDGKHVLDLCAGSGRASAALLAAYPTANVTLVDASHERLAIAHKRLLAAGADAKSVRLVAQAISLETDDSEPNRLLGSATPVDVVVACLALHVLAEQPAHYAASAEPVLNAEVSKEATYERIFRRIFESLAPGGHVVFGDHVGQLGLFAQLTIMARVGFVDVDCAWRQDDSFVAGGRRPLESSQS